jgi:chorismate-pyruvate lyase
MSSAPTPSRPESFTQLLRLASTFLEGRADGLLEHCREVVPQALPAAAQWLLWHEEHMTTRLRDFHGRELELVVLREVRDGEAYSRRIVLRLAGSERVVECGIMRIDLSAVPAEVRSEILLKQAPLGDILIRANVLRRIQPRWYFEFSDGSPILEGFGAGGPRRAWGRIGSILLEERTVVELLEVVPDEPRAEPRP